MDIRYITSAAKGDQLPPPEAPEVGFLGRSNVGKSTLINAMTGRKNLARTSRVPGRTQMANYFTVADKWWLVDLPGYGFTKLSPSQKQHWEGLMNSFLRRPSIASIVFLKDIRREWDETDIELLRWATEKHQVHIAFTKADKVKRADYKPIQSKTVEELRAKGIEVGNILVTSALKKINTTEIWEQIELSAQSMLDAAPASTDETT